MHGPVIAPDASGETAFSRVMASNELRCGYFNWPPYVMRDPVTGAMSGINVDYIETVANELGWKINWALEVNPGEAIEALNAGKVDAMCATLWPDGARAKNLLMTEPTFYTAIYAYVRSDNTRFDGDLGKINSESVTIAALDGDVTYSVAKNDFPKAKIFALPQMADVSQLLLSVINGRADVVIVGKSEVQHFNANTDTKLREVTGVPAAYVFGESFALKQGEFQFKNTLDTVIQRMNNNGLGQKLLAKYNYTDGYFPVAADFNEAR
ncbi:MAG: substrate-binding periplasmic protein [Bdellovibrionales bacterium]